MTKAQTVMTSQLKNEAEVVEVPYNFGAKVYAICSSLTSNIDKYDGLDKKDVKIDEIATKDHSSPVNQKVAEMIRKKITNT